MSVVTDSTRHPILVDFGGIAGYVNRHAPEGAKVFFQSESHLIEGLRSDLEVCFWQSDSLEEGEKDNPGVLRRNRAKNLANLLINHDPNSFYVISKEYNASRDATLSAMNNVFKLHLEKRKLEIKNILPGLSFSWNSEL